MLAVPLRSFSLCVSHILHARFQMIQTWIRTDGDFSVVKIIKIINTVHKVLIFHWMEMICTVPGEREKERERERGGGYRKIRIRQFSMEFWCFLY